MVGVPGKYQGCNTCRLRRVKCDNERPFCKKCTNTGRECGGYERETVFIIGTIEDGGRCSSHPPRVVKGSKKKGASSRASDDDEKLELVAEPPLAPAWNDLLAVSNQGRPYQVQIAALQTPLQSLVRDAGGGAKFVWLAFPEYEPADARPALKEEDFGMRAQCLVHLSAQEEGEDENGRMATDSICLFLFEHNNSAYWSNQPPWKDPTVQNNTVRKAGPEAFRTFPNHHFFARVYRHNAIFAALLNRKPTFLAGTEWISTPWERHPKSQFDYLFDNIVRLPSLFHRGDHIFALDPTLQRRLLAQDLLGNCLNVESQFDDWYASVLASRATATAMTSSDADETHQPPLLFWLEDATGGSSSGRADAQIPFADTFAFPDRLTAVTLLYYWTAQVLLFPLVERLHAVVLERVLDAWGPAAYPVLPARLAAVEFNARYGAKEVLELAASVCRALDFALRSTVQPDMLAVPLRVVREFYEGINAQAGDGQLELMWCEAFQGRMVARGQSMVDVVKGRAWREVASW